MHGNNANCNKNGVLPSSSSPEMREFQQVCGFPLIRINKCWVVGERIQAQGACANQYQNIVCKGTKTIK